MSGNNQSADDEFAAFEAAGTVEVGESQKDVSDGIEETTEGKKPTKTVRAPKPAAKPDIETNVKPGEGEDAGDDDSGEEGDDETDPKPKKTPAEHQIERLKREKRELNARLRAAESGGNAALLARLERLENGGLSGGNGSDTKTAEKPAPDPTDAKLYPLGHLDDRYIEDKLEWLADKKAAERADAILSRQQENERNETVNAQQRALLDKVDELSTKGSEVFEDFHETVVEAGMRGDYALEQTTFEACADAEHGVQILYDLSQDPKEAKRVANLSPLQQLKFVQERDAEIAGSKKGRTKPQAGDPPRNLPRGANSKTQINPATNNLDDFEKAWEADEKKSR